MSEVVDKRLPYFKSKGNTLNIDLPKIIHSQRKIENYIQSSTESPSHFYEKEERTPLIKVANPYVFVKNTKSSVEAVPQIKKSIVNLHDKR